MPDPKVARPDNTEAGFKDARYVSAETLARRYFASRSDGLRPPANSEELLVAST